MAAGRITGENLTPQEALFLDAYISNGYNRADAVRKAGYITTTPSTRGATILQRSAVQKELRKRLEASRRSFFVQELDVLEGLYREANLNGKGATQAGRTNAWIAIGKHLGMFNEGKGKHGGATGTQINIINYNKESTKKDIEGEVVDSLKEVENAQGQLKELGLDD